jgi:hypothetical protein
MLIVSDLEQPYLPCPYDLLVSLSDSRAAIESFLVKLPNLFGQTQQTMSAMGKALKSAEKLIVMKIFLRCRVQLVVKLYVFNILCQIMMMAHLNFEKILKY